MIQRTLFAVREFIKLSSFSNSSFRRARHCTTVCTLGLLGFGVQASDFSFQGALDSGPLAGTAFAGTFGWSDPAPADGDLLLSSFALLLAGQSYALADADIPPSASFAGGAFVGLSYVDADGSTSSGRPYISLVAGFSSLSEAYLAYDSAGLGGFGSYSVTAVPEPGSWGLMLMGLGATAAALKRRRPAR